MKIEAISQNQLQQNVSALLPTHSFETVWQQQLLEKAEQDPQAKEQKKLKQATQDFEAFFLTQMLGEMRKTVPENSLFGNQNQEKMYRDLLDQELGKRLAEGRGVGLASMLYQQLTKTGESLNPALSAPLSSGA